MVKVPCVDGDGGLCKAAPRADWLRCPDRYYHPPAPPEPPRADGDDYDPVVECVRLNVDSMVNVRDSNEWCNTDPSRRELAEECENAYAAWQKDGAWLYAECVHSKEGCLLGERKSCAVYY